jgi:hypothetical protein
MRHIIFGILVLLIVSHAFAADEGGKLVETKEINYRGGIVTFSIPKHWIEEYEPDGGGTFYEDGPNTGTLRINETTIKSPNPFTSKLGFAALSSLKDVKADEIENLSNGNTLAKFIKRTTDQGQAITLYWWLVAHPIPPQRVRTATFSYTILSSTENLPKSAAELQFLDKVIRNATFHPALGE